MALLTLHLLAFVTYSLVYLNLVLSFPCDIWTNLCYIYYKIWSQLNVDIQYCTDMYLHDEHNFLHDNSASSAIVSFLMGSWDASRLTPLIFKVLICGSMTIEELHSLQIINIFRPEWNGTHFLNDIFKYVFLRKFFWHSICLYTKMLNNIHESLLKCQNLTILYRVPVSRTEGLLLYILKKWGLTISKINKISSCLIIILMWIKWINVKVTHSYQYCHI